MSKLAVEAKQTTITYNKGKVNEFNALKNISVDIHSREYIILFGPSGCGKSTLLYTILGGVPPAGGTVNVFGEDIYAYSPAEMNRYQQSTIGIIYQQFNLIPSISVLDNVALPMIFMGIPLKERTRRGQELLRRFGIPDRLEDKRPTLMSGGQQQRVAVSRALVNDPDILLADEPVGNLDSISAEQVMGTLEDINEQDRKTVILVTHDAKYLPYAHRVFYMRDGNLRRVVVNPEKQQIKRVKPGETIVTEIEQLARLYPYAEPLELKVKSIVNYATQSLGFDQLERLERSILQVLRGTINDEMFFDYLVKPIKDGGVGMERTEAAETTRRVFTLMKHSQDVRRFRDEVHRDSTFFRQRELVDRLLEYLSVEMKSAATPQQIQVLRTAITDRVGGIIESSDFEERLGLPLDMGGAEFSPDVAFRATTYLEKLIAQGGYVILPNELLGAHS